MNLAAIVAEYNPFHNGHQYQLEEIRRQGASHIMVVMSGNVVQRSEVACFSKWTRAAAAVRGGADLVIELPAIYSCASAMRFASGAVQTLGGLGLPATLVFGSECGDLDALRACIGALDAVDGSEELKLFLSQGFSFPNARDRALIKVYGEKTAALLREPNNTLAVEYLKAIDTYHIPFQAATIRRVGPAHDCRIPTGRLASATLIREIAQQSGVRQIAPYVPGSAYSLYRHDFALKEGGASMYELTPVILYHLRSLSAQQFANLPDVSEGLEYRFCAAVQQAYTLDELMMRVKTKRYPLSRIKRILLYAMLGITKEIAALEPGYVRVLAFNEKGREILKAAKKSSYMPVYHSFAKLERDFPVHAEKEALASDLFRFALPKIHPGISEYRDQRPSFIPFDSMDAREEEGELL